MSNCTIFKMKPLYIDIKFLTQSISKSKNNLEKVGWFVKLI